MLLVLLGTFTLASPPLVAATPMLRPGDELVYTGDILEESLRPEQLGKRSSKIELRAFVLSVSDSGADLALLTLLRAQDNAGIAKVAVEVNGAAKETRRPPAVRLELIRIDASGIHRLMPESAPPPLVLTARTPSQPCAPLALSEPAAFEVGPFPPRPAAGARPGDRWVQPEWQRPDLAWTAKPAVVLDGAEVIEFAAEQTSEKWAKPNAFDKPWRRTERVWLAPADGIARVVWRRIEHNDGPAPALRIDTRLDLQPTVPYRGEGLDRVRREIEFAWWFGTQLEKLPAEQHAALAAKIARYCEDYPATPYREAVEAVARRCQKK